MWHPCTGKTNFICFDEFIHFPVCKQRSPVAYFESTCLSVKDLETGCAAMERQTASLRERPAAGGAG